MKRIRPGSTTAQRLLLTIVRLVPLFLIYDFGLMIFIGPSAQERTRGWQEVLLYAEQLWLAAALPHLWRFLEITAYACTFWLGAAIIAARLFAPRRAVTATDLGLLLCVSLITAVAVTAIQIWWLAEYGGPNAPRSFFN